jgi:uncharacterized NAD(P)/FAD-binding protein YdhS
MRNATPSICVVGGGFTGVAATIACLRRVNRPFRLILVEPSAALGGGVAFGGQDPLHLLNVRARDLSIHADRPSDFLSWAFRQLDQGERTMTLCTPDLRTPSCRGSYLANMCGSSSTKWSHVERMWTSTTSLV